jgi:hypothetical protein
VKNAPLILIPKPVSTDVRIGHVEERRSNDDCR